MNKWLYLVLLFTVSVISCKRIYQPPAITASNNFLVVEGTISGGPDSTFIRLSRTVRIFSKLTSKPELNAIVTIEDDQNLVFPLTETGNGNYGYTGLNLDHTHKYRLRIKTSNGEQYLSDLVQAVDSPPIDSVSYDVNCSPTAGPGLNVYVSTHDQTSNTRYYRWDYQETWIFHSFFPSYYYSDGDTVRYRNQYTQNVTHCWASDTSSTIILASTTNLSKSVILNNPITFVSSTSEKVETQYSILVRQYELTPEAYDYYSAIKKNTEQIGSIFDAQPSTIQGNIHCISDPSKPALGYITAGNPTSQRIFIANYTLPAWAATYPYPDCHIEPKCCYYNFSGVDQVDFYINYKKSGIPHWLVPIDKINALGDPIGFYASSQECVDCTIRGTNKMPPFWKPLINQ
ncbi:MAG: DUF4249 domain-containing protein [Bacteroidetes bacterium]|nr:DUF4249 domain-containing protein [Bacteroidota bacterium]